MEQRPIHSRVKRAERVMSHALVELRPRKWWPFGVKSAVLLDISATGFKIELTGACKIDLQSRYWMTIPLGPFGMASPPSIQVAVTVRWFDEVKMRVGGTFEKIQDSASLYMDKIVDAVKEQPLS